ncbi:hypothetical protein GALMADRAFT_1119625 [Galerina marginata CBS 339.88]|uniref:Uncharacterized protein n=1 Tax=Galerina marginata (strain CBS 339.88) TaxID=685588 RepID=A0A067TM88_GALM3|nr:hypothetical protein GALMADRAFT_1119625 [Galerina marginata CBS 339.88]
MSAESWMTRQALGNMAVHPCLSRCRAILTASLCYHTLSLLCSPSLRCSSRYFTLFSLTSPPFSCHAVLCSYVCLAPSSMTCVPFPALPVLFGAVHYHIVTLPLPRSPCVVWWRSSYLS